MQQKKPSTIVLTCQYTLERKRFEVKNLIHSFNNNVQGDPNQSLLFQMAITLKICICDPMLLKPKCVLKASIYFNFSAVCLQFQKINGGLQNTFWLYQYGVRNVYFQSYNHLK